MSSENSNSVVNEVISALGGRLDGILASTEACRSEFASYMTANDNKVKKVVIRQDKMDNRVLELEKRLAVLEQFGYGESSAVPNQEIMKQQQLKCNICLHGIVAIPDENLNSVAHLFCTKLNVKLTKGDIIGVHRTKPSARSPGLVCIKFGSYEKKMEVVNAKRNHGRMNLAAINLEPANNQIFVNHQMTPFFASLYHKARSVIFDGIFSACWIGSDGLRVRLPDGNTKTVRNMNELETLIATAPNTGASDVVSIASSDSPTIGTAPNTSIVRHSPGPVVKKVRTIKRNLEASPPSQRTTERSSDKKRKKSALSVPRKQQHSSPTHKQ